MSACVVGGMLVQWPIGRFSDHVDRRWVIFGTCLAAALAGVLLTLDRNIFDWVLLILGACHGAAALSIYSLCVAHANDRADPTTFVEISSHLLLAFGLGAIIGPFLAGLLISEFGTASLFVFTAGIHASLAVFVLFRTRAQEPPPEAERSAFAPHPPVTHGTQAVLELQPGVEHDSDVTTDLGDAKGDTMDELPERVSTELQSEKS